MLGPIKKYSISSVDTNVSKLEIWDIIDFVRLYTAVANQIVWMQMISRYSQLRH